MERPPCKYKLKKGAVLQAFGNADMFCTSDSLTDERAEWHLQHTRGAAALFEVIANDAPEYIDPAIVPAEPVKLEKAATVESKPAAR